MDVPRRSALAAQAPGRGRCRVRRGVGGRSPPRHGRAGLGTRRDLPPDRRLGHAARRQGQEEGGDPGRHGPAPVPQGLLRRPGRRRRAAREPVPRELRTRGQLRGRALPGHPRPPGEHRAGVQLLPAAGPDPAGRGGRHPHRRRRRPGRPGAEPDLRRLDPGAARRRPRGQGRHPRPPAGPHRAGPRRAAHPGHGRPARRLDRARAAGRPAGARDAGAVLVGWLDPAHLPGRHGRAVGVLPRLPGGAAQADAGGAGGRVRARPGGPRHAGGPDAGPGRPGRPGHLPGPAARRRPGRRGAHGRPRHPPPRRPRSHR